MENNILNKRCRLYVHHLGTKLNKFNFYILQIPAYGHKIELNIFISVVINHIEELNIFISVVKTEERRWNMDFFSLLFAGLYFYFEYIIYTFIR